MDSTISYFLHIEEFKQSSLLSLSSSPLLFFIIISFVTSYVNKANSVIFLWSLITLSLAATILWSFGCSFFKTISFNLFNFFRVKEGKQDLACFGFLQYEHFRPLLSFPIFLMKFKLVQLRGLVWYSQKFFYYEKIWFKRVNFIIKFCVSNFLLCTHIAGITINCLFL